MSALKTEWNFSILGMTCANCVRNVEKAIQSVPGVQDIAINLASEDARVRGELGLSEQAIVAAVKAAGYRAIALQLSDSAVGPRLGWDYFHVALALSVGIFLMIFGMSGHISSLAQFLLVTPVQFWSGWSFLAGAYHGVKQKNLGMDFLVAMGTLASYFYSVVQWLGGNDPHHLYFEASAFLIGFVLLGKLLEKRAKSRAARDLKSLISWIPKKVSVYRDGLLVERKITDLQMQDRCVVRNGERVPADAQLVQGPAVLDEALLNGESLPVDKKTGDRVFAGTVNRGAPFEILIDQDPAHTLLSGMVELLRSAQASKAPIQALADRVSGIFVPVVVVLALTTFSLWHFAGHADFAVALDYAISVLVISCPCALGLATPMAVIVGSGASAFKGILFKDAAALQKLEKVRHVVFDKTGTLTRGEASVIRHWVAAGRDEFAILALVAQVEAQSTHPFAKALLKHCGASAPTSLAGLTEVPGRGMRGHSSSLGDFFLGSLLELSEKSIPLPSLAQDFIQAAEPAGFVVLVANGQVSALFALRDPVRPEAASVVRELQLQGFRVTLLSGDRDEVVRTVAAEVGIEDFRSQLLPADKLKLISQYRAESRTPNARLQHSVAMVGDGVNDAPAIAQADVGIALSTGSDISIQAADVSLVGGDLEKLLGAMDASRKTMRKVRENLFASFLYNALAIPLAAGLFAGQGWRLSPMIASAAMALSSLCVVGNSLLLRRQILKK